MNKKTKRRLETVSGRYIASWQKYVTFKDDLAVYFFIGGLLAMMNTAYTLGRRDEAKRRKASAARRWKRRQVAITPPHVYPACTCKAQTPYRGEWHSHECLLYQSDE